VSPYPSSAGIQHDTIHRIRVLHVHVSHPTCSQPRGTYDSFGGSASFRGSAWPSNHSMSESPCLSRLRPSRSHRTCARLPNLACEAQSSLERSPAILKALVWRFHRREACGKLCHGQLVAPRAKLLATERRADLERRRGKGRLRSNPQPDRTPARPIGSPRSPGLAVAGRHDP
jgi:hypothetical protein